MFVFIDHITIAKGVKGVLDMHFVGFIFGHGNSPSLIIVRGGSTPCYL